MRAIRRKWRWRIRRTAAGAIAPSSSPAGQRSSSARVPRVSASLPGSELRWSVELVNRTSLNDPAFRIGGEMGFQKQLFLRAGYASGSGDATGPSLGLGFVRGAISIDFARLFSGLSADAGEPPTFLSVRVSW